MKKRPHSRHRKYTNRNRSWDTRQHTFALTMKGTAAVILAALGFVSCLVVRHSCESLADAIAREEARGRALEAEFTRESTRWNETCSAANLRSRLLAHGIAMEVPSGRQRIAMRGSGSRPAGAASGAGSALAANR